MRITAQEGNSPGSWNPRHHRCWSPEVEGQQTQSGELRKLAQLAPNVPLLGPWGAHTKPGGCSLPPAKERQWSYASGTEFPPLGNEALELNSP